MLLKKCMLPCLVAASLVAGGCESRYMAPLLVGSAAVIGTAALVGYAASQEKKKQNPGRQGDYVVTLSSASGSSFDKVANRRGVSEFLLSDVRQEDATLEDRWNNSEYNHEKHGVFCYFREDSPDDVRFVIARRGR